MIKMAAGLVALTSVAVAAVIVVGGRNPAERSAAVPLKIVSPADTFSVRDAPPAPAAPQPAPSAAPVATPAAPPAGLDAAIERLRAQAPPKPDLPAPLAVVPAPPAADPLLAGPNPVPSILSGPPVAVVVPQVWTAVTAQGARWRQARDAAGLALVIDLGGGRAATVRVDPAFGALPPEAAGQRVDFLKQTILEDFPPGSTQFRFARDGSVSLQR